MLIVTIYSSAEIGGMSIKIMEKLKNIFSESRNDEKELV